MAVQRKIKVAAKELREYLNGDTSKVRITTYTFPDVKAIREKLGLTQTAFARRFSLSVGTIRDWEQRRRYPDQAAQNFLRVVAKNPKAVMKALG